MDNWLTFLLVNVVLVIVLGVLTNLMTPSIKSAWDKSIFSSNQKRVTAILDEYVIRSYTHHNKQLITPFILGFITRKAHVILVSITGFGIVLAIISTIKNLPSGFPLSGILTGLGIAVAMELTSTANQLEFRVPNRTSTLTRSGTC